VRYWLLAFYIFLFFFLLIESFLHWFIWGAFILYLPILYMAIRDFNQTESNIRKNYPFLGTINEFLDKQRHVLQEVLLQNRWEGRPFSLLQINYVKKKANDSLMSLPFGSELDFSSKDYFWCEHSLYPLKDIHHEFRVKIGSSLCQNPYESSIINVGAMSFGSISSAAVSALCNGAKKENFAVNTGEGGISKYHWESGCDLIWQIGTAYFGCRDKEGNFDEVLFQKQAIHEQVKMIEIKISQGAKPGFGAILPASKNTEEIAKIRMIRPHTEVHSPGYHSMFSSHEELLAFIDKLRDLSNNKPIGIKLCLGKKEDFKSLCQLMRQYKMYPDFIVIEGGEGGSGAADLDSIHHMGWPLSESLKYVVATLRKNQLKDEIKVISTGKVLSSIDIANNLSKGADLCYSARGMMFSLGCVQSLKCNTNKCPTGITTMDQARISGLDVTDKTNKVANYQRNLIKGLANIYKASGIDNLKDKEKLKFNTLKKVYS
tara:strand:+ start:2281 stop:3744 length:1464 start_codon:yes stop_codon:yes gene_type:complete